jgi:hypothetical protein
MAWHDSSFEILSDPRKGLVKCAIVCAILGIMFGLVAGVDPFSVGLLGAGLVTAGAVLCADRGKDSARETPPRACPPTSRGHVLAEGHTPACERESNHFQEMVSRTRERPQADRTV